MSTLTASPSGHLVRPGAPSDECDERLLDQVPSPMREPWASNGQAWPDREEGHVREVAWTCEWWPPT